MNAFSRIAPAVTVLLTLTFFSSCYKIYDYVKQHPGSEVDVCRVKYLVQGTDTVTIHYNAAGDPIDMIKNHLVGGGAWQSDKVFRYDNKQRLTDYIWATAGSNYRLIWHRYSYPRKSIVTDSAFAYIENGTGPNPPIQNFNGFTIDSLDAQGRVVKSTEPNGDTPYIANYVYNAQGNVVLPNSMYDNKLSILHTNKVWMYLNRDYSVNNRLSNEGGLLQISKYNQAGLPLDFSIAPGYHGSDVLFVIISSKLLVTYDCD